MKMKIAVLLEREKNETRVGAIPETVKKLIGFGADVYIEKNAGKKSHFLDAEYKEAGATISATSAACVKNADIVLSVRRPKAAILKGIKKDALSSIIA